MVYKRLIPVLILDRGLLVRSEIFSHHQAIGDPIPTIKRLSDWSVDEIILLDISNNQSHDSRRDDKLHNISASNLSGLIKEVSKFCFCPLTVGGGLKSIDQIRQLFENGADKITVNSALFDNPELVKQAVRRYGSQAILASLDVYRLDNGDLSIYKNNGKCQTGYDLISGIELALSLGVGEILISSINNDGGTFGYDQVILDQIPRTLGVPIIINSGAKEVSHFEAAFNLPNVSACAASNVFYFSELSYPLLKLDLIQRNIKLREAITASKYLTREPLVASDIRNKLLLKGEKDVYFDKAKYSHSNNSKNRIACSRCLYPYFSATPMMLDSENICMGCRMYEVRSKFSQEDYTNLKTRLNSICHLNRSPVGYDCIVSVSGGKDSYYQTHYVIHELGLKPLLVTYNGNNYSNVGWRNLMRMRECFNCDHLIISPSVQVIKKLNKIAFTVMGDMNWHSHAGIFTTAPRIACAFNIPLIFWGEHGYADLCGQFSMHDYPEMNYRERTEHACRGFDWNFFVGIDGITEAEMEPWKYPTDRQLMSTRLRQIYLGHYIKWESTQHLQEMKRLYGFEISEEPFQRTYRRGSNLDDIHENGVHDYLKYIKFGYGRCTDHASKDIRSGLMSREEGQRYVNTMDHVKPNDLARWLEYVDLSEEDFDRIADHFRDPRVWGFSDSRGWFLL